MSAWWWGAVAVAGAAGAACRHVVDFAVSRRLSGLFPWGTFVVNVSGAFLFGVVAGIAGGAVADGLGLVLAVGFCGAYTTFSTHMVESMALAREGHPGRMVLNLLGSMLACLIAATTGAALGA